MVGEFVVVRTYTAGVHTGTLKEVNGTAVLLEDARRLWRWNGAFSLHEVSQKDGRYRFADAAGFANTLLTQAIEVIPCSPKAKANLSRSRNGA